MPAGPSHSVIVPENVEPRAPPPLSSIHEISAGMLKNFSYLMLKYTEKYQLPCSSVDSFAKDIVTMTEHSQELVYDLLRHHLLTLGIDTNAHPTLKEILEASMFDGVRQHLFTSHGSIQHAKASFKYVAARELATTSFTLYRPQKF